jgi:ATP-binding cassette subfamily C (CFTR/MRP) protein 1
VATSCVNIGILIFNHVSVPLLQSYILEPLTLFVSGFLVHTNHKRTVTSSAILLLFWPAYIFGLVIWGRTLLLTHPHASDAQVLLALRCTVAGLGLGCFALELIAPTFESESDEDDMDVGHVANPIVTANIFSKLTFMYMTSLLKKG